MKKRSIFLLLLGMILVLAGCACETGSTGSAEPRGTLHRTVHTAPYLGPQDTDTPSPEIVQTAIDLPDIPLTEAPSDTDSASASSSETTDTPACLHSHVTVTVSRQPTVTQSGEKKYTCSDCGATWTETVPRLLTTGIELPEVPLR